MLFFMYLNHILSLYQISESAKEFEQLAIRNSLELLDAEVCDLLFIKYVILIIILHLVFLYRMFLQL